MKILFLQKVDNACGGVTNVNLNLITRFLQLGHQVDVLSVRHGDTWEQVNYPEGAQTHLINGQNVWGCPRLKDILATLKRGNLVDAGKIFLDRIAYKRQIAKDYKVCQKVIAKLEPDVIINSHYEVLDGIGKDYLKKTIMHFHTNFGQVLENRSYRKMFEKYTSKIFAFVWLSEKTKQEAISHGITNSTCIYNPLAFSEERRADMSNKKMLFVGRLSQEKRVELAIQYFKEVAEENGFQDWTFEIYGAGELEELVISEIQGHPQIFYKGRTEKVNDTLLEGSILVLTSEFEGMPLVVLEANECGVPVLAYDFGESSTEVILHGETGILVPQNEKETFKIMMKTLFEDEEYRRELSTKAKEFAKDFAIENIGNQWLKLFDEMES